MQPRAISTMQPPACRCTSPNHGHANPCPQSATEGDGYCKPCHDAAAREWAQTVDITPGAIKARLSAQIRTQAIIDELKKRGVTNDRCPRCDTFDWSVDFLEIPARPTVNNPTVPLKYLLHADPQFAQPMPTGFIRMVCIACRNCGYTMFHNLDILQMAKQK
jgi:hypothetical protein